MDRREDQGFYPPRQSQSTHTTKRRTTVAEQLIQSFSVEPSTGGPGQHQYRHQIPPALPEHTNFNLYLASQPNNGPPPHFATNIPFPTGTGSGGFGFGRGRQAGSSSMPRNSGFTYRQPGFTTASASSSKYALEELETYKSPHDPHPIDPRFMLNTMSRIARVAGRPVGNFYSTRANDPLQTEHVTTHRPASRLRFNLPDENASDETVVTNTNTTETPESARENLRKLRQWERTTLGHLVGESASYGTMGDGTRFTVLSYNVLAPSLLETHKYLYKDCNPKALEWEYRLELFFKEVAEFKADIVCLQEVEAMHFLSSYEPRMTQKGFKGIYKKRTREKEDGCAIFWKQSLFSLIGKLSVEYYQPHVPLLDRDNVGLLVKLQSKVGRRPKLVVGTTHVLYNPKRNDVKLAQVQLLLSELDRFAFSGFSKSGEVTYNHMILTGDFNADPYNSIIRFITDGELQYLNPHGVRPNVLLKQGMSDFIPPYIGISDQCQHYKVILERYKMFRATRKNVFEMDLTAQAPLVNLYADNTNSYSLAPKGSAMSNSAHRSTSNISRPTNSSSSGMNNHSKAIPVIDLTGEGHDQVDEASAQGKIMNKDNLPSDKDYKFDARQHERLLEEIYKSGTLCTFGSGELSHKLRMRSVYAPKLDRVEGTDGIATTRQSVWTCVDYMFYGMQWSDMQRRRVEGNLKLLRRLGLMTRNQCKQNGHLPSLAVPSDHFPLVAEFVLK